MVFLLDFVAYRPPDANRYSVMDELGRMQAWEQAGLKVRVIITTMVSVGITPLRCASVDALPARLGMHQALTINAIRSNKQLSPCQMPPVVLLHSALSHTRCSSHASSPSRQAPMAAMRPAMCTPPATPAALTSATRGLWLK